MTLRSYWTAPLTMGHAAPALECYSAHALRCLLVPARGSRRSPDKCRGRSPGSTRELGQLQLAKEIVDCQQSRLFRQRL